MLKLIKTVFSWPLIALVKLYQWVISPLIPPSCRFEPTCSVYCVEALKRYGPFKGFILALRRIIRCRPGQPGGYDPLP